MSVINDMPERDAYVKPTTEYERGFNDGFCIGLGMRGHRDPSGDEEYERGFIDGYTVGSKR